MIEAKVEEYQLSGEISGLARRRVLFATCFMVLCKSRDLQRISASNIGR
jgi:hypothetical protein